MEEKLSAYYIIGVDGLQSAMFMEKRQIICIG